MEFKQSSDYLAAQESTAGLRRTLSRAFMAVALVGIAITLLCLEAVQDPLYTALCAAGRGLQTVGRAMGQDVWFLLLAGVVVLGIAQAFCAVRRALLTNLAKRYVTLPPSPEQGTQAVAWAERNRRGLHQTFYGCMAVQLCAGVAVVCAPEFRFAGLSMGLLMLNILGFLVWPDGETEPFCIRHRVVAEARSTLCPEEMEFADWCLSPDGLAWARKMTLANLLDLTQPAGETAFAKAAASARDCEKGNYAVALAKSLAQALR